MSNLLCEFIIICRLYHSILYFLFIFLLIFFFFFFFFYTFFFFFFFFQAEDGIRDADVTGVQTCALPILINILLNVQNYVCVYPSLSFKKNIISIIIFSPLFPYKPIFFQTQQKLLLLLDRKSVV